MQIPPIDRSLSPRPVAAELASMAATQVIPVAAVNPVANPGVSIEPTPSVINMIGQAAKSSVGEGVYSSVSDPTRRGSEAATAEKDWTIQRPKPETVEAPAPVPRAQVETEYAQSLWVASASAVQVQQQVKNQLDASQQNPNLTPGVLANEAPTYSISKISKANKTENM